jgi:hypothetical protein
MSNSRIYNRIQNNFTQVSNLALLDTRLSGKAYKLYAYMVFRIGTAPDWYFYEEEILKHFKESRDAIRTAFKELIDNGWLIRRRLKNNKGQYSMTEYEIFSEPQNTSLNPQTENPSVVSPSVENPSEEKAAQEKPAAEKTSYNNKERKNKDSNNKEFLSLSLDAKKERLKEIWKEKGLKSDSEKYALFREKSNWKGVSNLEADIAWWENGFKDKNPHLYEKTTGDSLSPTETKLTESPEIIDRRTKIKQQLCWDVSPKEPDTGTKIYNDLFLYKEIQKTDSGFVIKVTDARALQYQEILEKINVKIEL